MLKKLWFRLFISLGTVLVCASLLIIAAESTLLVNFYVANEKTVLRASANELESINMEDTSAVYETLSGFMQKQSIITEVYKSTGEIVYTTENSGMFEFSQNNRANFKMLHNPLQIQKSKSYTDGTVIYTGIDRSGKEYLVCQKQLTNGYTAELRIRSELLQSSAYTAGRLVVWITLACLLPSLVAVYLFTRKFSKPVTDMTEITSELANLNFSRRVNVTSDDEISNLGNSVNNMADSLETALTELKTTNAKLSTALEEERNLDAMRKALVANVSHELKTPIAVISGYAEGLKLNINNTKRKEYCDIILDESRRMNKLVLSILELARYESGKVKTSPERFDISVLSENMIKNIFANSTIKAENKIEAQSFVFADELRIEEILKAYLENALAYTDENGEVSVTAEKKGESLKISVFNTGEKISTETMPKIWQSFYRGDTSHKRTNSSFGLGLSIVSALCKADGQQCGVYNTENGVCFWFTTKAAE